MFGAWYWLFGKPNEEEIAESDYFGDDTEQANENNTPYDFDDYDWYNPADWFGNYDKSLDDYNDRKKAENEKQNRIYFYIFAGLLGIYLIRR